MSFNFAEEMVKGKKHMDILNNYDNNKYDFRPFAIECFKTEKLNHMTIFKLCLIA